MRVVGVDPSSTLCGAAIVDHPQGVVAVGHWRREKRSTHPEALLSWFRWLESFVGVWHPHMAAIEMLSVERNANTAKVVAFYQSAAALCCKMHGLVVVEVRVSTARSIVLGNGGMSKDDAWEVMRKRYPGVFSVKTSGGIDEMDAVVCGLAGPTAAER